MDDLQNFQDCTNKNNERLKEKLEELNLNNNKVSFDEYSEEKPIKRRKKTKKKVVSSEDEENEEPLEKPKRPRTQKQIEAFSKARAHMIDNAEHRKRKRK